MRVATKLARMEFVVGTLEPDGDTLVIRSGGDERSMAVRATIEPTDVAALARQAMAKEMVPYLLRLPALIWRGSKQNRAADPSPGRGIGRNQGAAEKRLSPWSTQKKGD